MAKLSKAARNNLNPHQIAAHDTWERPEVRAARSARDKVAVKAGSAAKEVFRSTGAAFEAYGLPLGKLQSFRKELKSEGKASIKVDSVTYRFEIVAK